MFQELEGLDIRTHGWTCLLLPSSGVAPKNQGRRIPTKVAQSTGVMVTVSPKRGTGAIPEQGLKTGGMTHDP